MTKKIIWRLGKLPSTEELRELVKDKIITQDEAREILFLVSTEKDVSENDLKSEIKFLRELVEKLSQGKTQIIKEIETIRVPYYTQPWYHPYAVWCGTTTDTAGTITSWGSDTSVGGNYTACSATGTGTTACSFSDIKTF